ncbi:hypothetical protein EVAR_32179_1 [Eumeta japonica]|uniref:Carbonyl reductase n=1 Tax=Eumeta variegata TaxID=151549 RepID=A0A4C1VXU7_EUMVA|nr:hypothetical protein EVAR_32179_1 [Eumeta japonica]
MTEVAVVVGAASNLGYQVLKQLSEAYKGKIYFTTEDEVTGQRILKNVRRNNIEIYYHQLDVTDTRSIVEFRHDFQDEESGIDLLINNTEYTPKKERDGKVIPNAEKVRRILNVNFYGNLNLGNLLYPLLNENARVVNVSGPAGLLATIPNGEVRWRISRPNLTEDDLVELMQEYEAAARRGVDKTEGWGHSPHAVSKVALNALTFIQHRKWSAQKGVVINCVNPGSLTNRENRKDLCVFENGAKAILYLALEAPLSIKGNFVWSNYAVIEWNSDPFVEFAADAGGAAARGAGRRRAPVTEVVKSILLCGNVTYANFLREVGRTPVNDLLAAFERHKPESSNLSTDRLNDFGEDFYCWQNSILSMYPTRRTPRDMISAEAQLVLGSGESIPRRKTGCAVSGGRASDPPREKRDAYILECYLPATAHRRVTVFILLYGF